MPAPIEPLDILDLPVPNVRVVPAIIAKGKHEYRLTLTGKDVWVESIRAPF